MPEGDVPRLIVGAARACIGVRFVPQGRDPAHGLDCVGLVAHAYAAAGVDVAAPRDYGARGGTLALWRQQLARDCLVEVEGAPALGDLMALIAGPAQLHLGLWSGTGLIHAHAGLRRVVETPGPPPWPIIGIWRLHKEAE